MLLLCFKIFVSRIIDVTLSSVRTMFIVKCNKIVASLIAFVEIFIWFYAAKEALVTDIDSIFIVISYALGYATGTFVGTFINERFVSGIYSVNVSLNKINNKLINDLEGICYDVINIKTEGKNILNLTVDKKNYKNCIEYLYKIDKSAKVLVTESKLINFNKLKIRKSDKYKK